MEKKKSRSLSHSREHREHAKPFQACKVGLNIESKYVIRADNYFKIADRRR